MSHPLRRFAALASLLLPVPLAASEAPASAPQTVYLATVVDTSHVSPRGASMPIRVRLDRLTSDERVAELVGIAHEKGEPALRRALAGEALGRLEIDGRLGDPITYARRIEDADGAHLLLVALRSVSIREVFGSRRSVDYPFTVVQIDLDDAGHGGGAYYGVARVRPQKDGEIEVDGLGILPDRLLAVRAAG